MEQQALIKQLQQAKSLTNKTSLITFYIPPNSDI